MKTKRPFIETPAEKAAFIYGIQLAADVAKDYDKYSYHTHLVSECILGKLNVMKGKPHPNPWARKIKGALDRLDRKVDALEGTTLLMAGGVEVRVLDMCWRNQRPLPKKHEPGCARERKRRGIGSRRRCARCGEPTASQDGMCVECHAK